MPISEDRRPEITGRRRIAWRARRTVVARCRSQLLVEKLRSLRVVIGGDSMAVRTEAVLMISDSCDVTALLVLPCSPLLNSDIGPPSRICGDYQKTVVTADLDGLRPLT